MTPRNKFLAIGIIVSIFILSGLTQGSIQAYESGSTKIKIDLPMSLLLKSDSTDNWIDLTKPGSEKPIIAIRIQEPYGQNLESYASSSGYKEDRIEAATDDGHRMLSFIEPGSTETYAAFIDYLEEKNKIVQIWSDSEVHAKGEILATFDRDGFHKIAKSFAFINDTEFQDIRARNSESSPGFETIFAIASIFGAIYAYRRLSRS